MSRLNGLMPRTAVYSVVAIASTVLGVPQLGILLSLFGLGDAANHARRGEPETLTNGLWQSISRSVLQDLDRGTRHISRDEARTGISVAFDYFQANPLTVERMAGLGIDRTRITRAQLSAAKDWYFERRDRWTDEDLFRIAEEAIERYCSYRVDILEVEEPIVVPIAQALLRGPDYRSNHDLAAVSVALAALVHRQANPESALRLEARNVAIEGEGERDRTGHERAPEVVGGYSRGAGAIQQPTWWNRWNDVRWLTQAGVVVMLLTLLATIIVPIVQKLLG